MKRIIGLLLVLFLSIALTCISSAEDDRLCDFPLRSGIFFGDDIKAVREKESLGEEGINEEDRAIFDNTDMTEFNTYSSIDLAGIEAEVIYYFDQNDHLIQLMYFFGSGLSGSEYDMLYSSLINKYGQPCDEEANPPFRGNSTNLQGYYALEAPTTTQILKNSGWLIKADHGYVKIDFCLYNTNSVIGGKVYDRDQARLGYLFVTEEEYAAFLEEQAAKQEQEQLDQEKKEYDLEHSI